MLYSSGMMAVLGAEYHQDFWLELIKISYVIFVIFHARKKVPKENLKKRRFCIKEASKNVDFFNELVTTRRSRRVQRRQAWADCVPVVRVEGCHVIRRGAALSF